MDLIEKTLNGCRHPWELSRTQCILNIINKYHFCNIVDIGAGDCFFTFKLTNYASGNVYAVDTEYTGKAKSANAGIIQCFNSITGLPETVDAAILMDVLEHVYNDNLFLKEILKELSADALVVITVPAFQSLFSNHDVFLRHYRRYDKKRLLALLHSNSLAVEKCHYFYISLLLARLLSLPLMKRKKADQHGIGNWRFNEKHVLTRAIHIILNIDFQICAFFAQFHIYPPGLSLLAVCRKRGESNV